MLRASRKRPTYFPFDDPVAEGFAYSADTIEGLAAQIDVPVEELTRTVATWNAMLQNGGDTQFYRADDGVAPIVEPPFYAARQCPWFSIPMAVPSVTSSGRSSIMTRIPSRIFTALASSALSGQTCITAAETAVNALHSAVLERQKLPGYRLGGPEAELRPAPFFAAAPFAAARMSHIESVVPSLALLGMASLPCSSSEDSHRGEGPCGPLTFPPVLC